MWCRRYERMISDAMDTGRALPLQVSRHMAACPRCRQFHAACVRLTDELPRTAWADPPAVPASLKGDIVRALDRSCSSAPLPRAARGNWRLYSAVATGVAAGLLLAFVCLHAVPKADKASPAGPASPAAAAPSLDPLAPLSELAKAAPHPLVPLSEAVANPLAQEWERLTEDTRAAAGFLISCLPAVGSGTVF